MTKSRYISCTRVLFLISFLLGTAPSLATDKHFSTASSTFEGDFPHSPKYYDFVPYFLFCQCRGTDRHKIIIGSPFWEHLRENPTKSAFIRNRIKMLSVGCQTLVGKLPFSFASSKPQASVHHEGKFMQRNITITVYYSDDEL